METYDNSHVERVRRWTLSQFEVHGHDKDTIPVWRVFFLAELARQGIYPDATCSDEECIIWSRFRHNN